MASVCCEDLGNEWRCGQCQVAVPFDSERCPTCGHWRCALDVEAFDGVEPGLAPRWYSLIRSPGHGWALGESASRLGARSAATLAAQSGRPFSNEGGSAQPCRIVRINGDMRIAAVEVFGGWHVVAIRGGAVGVGWAPAYGGARERALGNLAANAEGVA